MRGIVTVDDKKRNRLRASGNVFFPICYGLAMQHVHTDIETGKHLRCPEDNHIPEGQMLPCLGEMEVDPGDDIRLYGCAIRSGSPEWDWRYEGRYGVERLFAWWKLSCGLEGHLYVAREEVDWNK